MPAREGEDSWRVIALTQSAQVFAPDRSETRGSVVVATSLEEVDRAITQTRNLFLTAGVVLIAVLAAAGWFAVRSGLRRLRPAAAPCRVHGLRIRSSSAASDSGRSSCLRLGRGLLARASDDQAGGDGDGAGAGAVAVESGQCGGRRRSAEFFRVLGDDGQGGFECFGE